MKKSIFLFFAAILCAMSASARNVTKPHIYYDNSNTSYSNVAFVIGHDNYSRCYKLTKISNTNLWYRYLNGTGNDTWTDATQIAVFGVDWDSSEGSSISNRRNYTGDKYTNTLTLSSDLSSGKVYLVTASGNKSTTSIALKSGGYADLNYTQTVQQQLTTDGTTYNASTEAIATVKVAAYKLNNYNTTASNNGIIASGNSSATCSAARTATVTYTVSGVNSAYTFVGWYDGDTQKSTSSTYTYEATEAKTITARFAVATEEEHEVTITYVCGSNTVSAATSAYVGVETEKTFTAPTVTGYQFKNWTVGAGMTLKVGTENDATITVVTKSASSDYTLVANYEEVMETVYFINTGKWSDVYLHLWNGNATGTEWPGTQLTATGEKIGDYDVYSYTAKQGDHTNLLLHKKDDDSKKTGDLTWTAGKYYIYNYGGKSDWYTKEDAEELLVVPVVTHDIVVKAVAPEVWNSGTISIHYWGDGISATANPVATEKEGNWNKYTIKEVPEGTSVNVIFLNGTSWTDDKSKQTANITGITEDKCFQISAKTLDGEGKCTFTEVDCAADIKPEGDVYTVVGSSDELGLAWDPTKKANDMEKQSDGSYKKVYSNVELTTSVEWKIAKNGDWWNDTPLENIAANGNSVLVIAQSGIYNVTFTLSADLKTAHAEAELIEATNTVADCYISGNAALTGGEGWAGNEFQMEYTEATETYTYTFTGLVAATSYELKVVIGGAWHGFANLVNPAPTNVTEGNDHAIAFQLAEAGDVTVTYHATNGINLTGSFVLAPLTYTVTVPAGTEKCYICGAWDWETFKEMTPTANENEFTIDIVGAKETDEYKYACQADWDYAEKDAEGNPVANRQWAENDVVAKWGVPPTYTIVGAKAITGEDWNTKSAENIMAKVDGVYKLTKTGLKLENGNYYYKVAMNGEWGEGEYPNATNENVTIEANGVYDIVYTYTVGTSLTAVATKTGEYIPAQAIYTIAGNAALCGTEWKADDAHNDMKDNEDGTLTWTATGVKLAGNVAFKVVKNHDFAEGAYPDENWVIDLEGATGVYDITITFTEETKDIVVTTNKTGDLPTETLVYTVTVPEGTEKCYIAMDIDPAQDGWEFTEMTKVDETHWTITINDVTIATPYKYACQASWDYAEKVGSDRTWTAADEVTAWNKPVVYTYYLMGVNDDWATGIEMEVNTDAENEVMLTCQPVNGEVKIKRVGDDDSEYWFGGKSLKEDPANLGTNTEAATDGDGNIALEEGIYNFYFNTADGKLWIAAATGCVIEPEYNVVEDEITNFVFDTEAWPMVCTGGPSTTYQVEVYLTLTEDADGTLAYEDCSVSIMGTDATFIDGTLSNLDPYAPYADAVLHVQWDGDYYELQLAMSSTPAEAVTIEAEDATVTLTEYPTNFEETEFAYELAMVANWDNEAESLPYTVEFVIPTFDPTAASGEYIANFYVTGEGDAAGMNENVSVTVTKDGNNVTLTGNVSALNGNAYDVTISGTLPYTRTVTAGYYGTICLPFGSKEMTGATFFETSHFKDGIVYFNEVKELVAGHAYIFLASANEITVISDGTTAEYPVNVNGLYGTFEGITDVANEHDDKDEYIIVYNTANARCELSECLTGCTLDANRAYVVLAEVGKTPVQPMPGCRRVGMGVQGGNNTATGLDNITNGENTTIKVIENGQLFIIRGGEKFNAQGQKL